MFKLVESSKIIHFNHIIVIKYFLLRSFHFSKITLNLNIYVRRKRCD